MKRTALELAVGLSRKRGVVMLRTQYGFVLTLTNAPPIAIAWGVLAGFILAWEE